MRYRFFIARKPALAVCLLSIALSAPGLSARNSGASSVRINGHDVSTFLTARIGEPVQPKPKAVHRLDSPRLMALERKVKAGNRAAIKQFWEGVQGKAPLVEPVPDDDQLRRVTFLWRGGPEASQVTLDGQFPPDSQDAPLTRLANTDVWFLTLRLPATARFTYGFNRPGKKQRVDPLNPLKLSTYTFVELPG